jgi:hypothetical protein
MAVKRYNAGIQRAKGILEIAAALYDTSLSHQTRRAAEGTLQTDSPVGRALRLSLGIKASEAHNGLPLSFATGSFREIAAVANREFSLAWVNPSVMLTMAYRGKGPFQHTTPLADHRRFSLLRRHGLCGARVHRNYLVVRDRA